MNDRLLSLLGICRRAGKLVIGADPVKESIDTGKAFLVICANDISQNTEKKIRGAVQTNTDVAYHIINRTKDELSFSLGKTCATLAVIDKGFADKLVELITAEQKKEETTI